MVVRAKLNVLRMTEYSSPLTPKQQVFVAEYQKDFNGTQAAIRAGYSEDTARQQAAQMLRNAAVRDALGEAVHKRIDRAGIDADYVLDTILQTIERCSQAYPVLDRKGEQVYTETPTGEVVPAYDFDSKGVLKGCELLGKHLALFQDRLELTGKVDLASRIVEARRRAGR